MFLYKSTREKLLELGRKSEIQEAEMRQIGAVADDVILLMAEMIGGEENENSEHTET